MPPTHLYTYKHKPVISLQLNRMKLRIIWVLCTFSFKYTVAGWTLWPLDSVSQICLLFVHFYVVNHKSVWPKLINRVYFNWIKDWTLSSVSRTCLTHLHLFGSLQPELIIVVYLNWMKDLTAPCADCPCYVCHVPLRPMYGGRFCEGPSRSYKLCNTKDCPPGNTDFRAVQCAEFNSKPFRGWYYKWSPYTHVDGESGSKTLQCLQVTMWYIITTPTDIIPRTSLSPNTLIDLTGMNPPIMNLNQACQAC